MKAVLALGSNIGDRAATLQAALDALAARQEILARDVVASSIDFELTKPLLASSSRS